MKIAAIIARILMGLLFLFASITYFFVSFKQPEVTGSVKAFNEGIKASVYLMPLVKSIELLCGISFVTGRFVTLASVLISPIIVNIVLFHSFLDPQHLAAPIFLLLANSFLIYTNRSHYKNLFVAK